MDELGGCKRGSIYLAGQILIDGKGSPLQQIIRDSTTSPVLENAKDGNKHAAQNITAARRTYMLPPVKVNFDRARAAP